jgi:DNA-binding transcriptional regulator YiaG
MRTDRDRIVQALYDLAAVEEECRGRTGTDTENRLANVRRCLEEQLYGALSPSDFQRMRRATGLSQEALARRLGRTLRQIARYEQGRTPVPFKIAEQLQELAENGEQASGS